MIYVLLVIFLLFLGFKLKANRQYFKYYIYILVASFIVVLSIKFGKLIIALLAFLVPFLLKLSSFFIRNFNILNWFIKKRQNSSNLKTTKMSKEEAYKILGLKEGVTKAEIKLQYKKLMKANHPDKGGSKHISVLLNRAKDRLLND